MEEELGAEHVWRSMCPECHPEQPTETSKEFGQFEDRKSSMPEITL